VECKACCRLSLRVVVGKSQRTPADASTCCCLRASGDSALTHAGRSLLQGGLTNPASIETRDGNATGEESETTAGPSGTATHKV